MSKYEKLGNFLLFEKLEDDRLSKNFLAGQIADNQIQQIQVIKKFDPSLSTMPDFVLDLNQEFEIVKSLANPNIVRPKAFVREKSDFAAVFDYMEGKSLRAVLARCDRDNYPFSADHALLIGSRLCSALEYLHSKKGNDDRLLHGFVSPETIFVTYDGEIKLQYLGLVQALMKFPAGREKLFHDFKDYIAPELLQHNRLDKAADVYGAGLVLFEMLTGEALFAKGRDIQLSQVLNNAQLFLTSGDRAPLPDEIKKVLSQALSVDPAGRYSAIADMRKALDQILFTSDYAPTTFNLAFFMNSLFRENIDQEHKNLDGFKKTDVAPYMKEETAPQRKAEHPVGAEAAKDVASISMVFDRHDAMGEPQLFGEQTGVKEKSKMPLILGAAGVVAVIGVLAFLLFKPASPATTTVQKTPPAPTMTPSERLADAAERQKLQEEAQKAQEDARQKDVALKELQAKMDAMIKQQQKQQKENPAAAPAIDTATIQQMQEQARRLEEEKKKQQALAEEKLKAAQQPPVSSAPPPDTAQQQPAEQKPVQVAAATPVAPAPAANNPPAQPVQQSPSPVENADAKPATAVKEGDTVDLTPDVVRPELTKRVNPAYPPAAQRKRIEGTVICSALISERGDVEDVKVLRGAGGSSGLNEAAQQSIRQWKFRPAVKDGKRVKVWMTYPIVFKLD
jgi:TonB family protein